MFVKRVSDRIMFIKLVVRKNIVTGLSVYAPQIGLDGSIKDLFYENLQWTLTKISACLWVLQWSHWKEMQLGMREFMVVEDFVRLNLEGERIVEFAVSHKLVVSNSLFTKKESHLVTYQSGENQSQID